MSNVVEVQEWATQMIELMSPKRRRQLIRRILFDLRRANAKRMRSQVGPDGKQWQRRKNTSNGLGKKKLLQGFARAKHLKVKSSSDSGSLGFLGKKANRIAAIHHYGLLDRVSKKGPSVQYPARELIGISKQDEIKIDEGIADHFGFL